MERNSIEEKIRIILKENTILALCDENIATESDLIEDLGFDSLTIVSFISEIEKEYDIEFELDELSTDIIGKYGALLDLVYNKVNKK